MNICRVFLWLVTRTILIRTLYLIAASTVNCITNGHSVFMRIIASNEKRKNDIDFSSYYLLFAHRPPDAFVFVYVRSETILQFYNVQCSFEYKMNLEANNFSFVISPNQRRSTIH